MSIFAKLRGWLKRASRVRTTQAPRTARQGRLIRPVGRLIVASCTLGLGTWLPAISCPEATAADRVNVAALREPRVAERDAMRVRVVNRPNHAPGVVHAAPQVDPVSLAPRGEAGQAPESYPAQDAPRQFSVYGMNLTQKPIGLDILDNARDEDPSNVPENFAAQILPREQKIDVTRGSRYREDFAIPVDLSASQFCHRPLYFEEVNLERYGASHGPWQPIISGARFFATVPALPYLMTVHKPCVCRYWPHQYPAGRCAPVWEPEGPPFDLEAAGVEGLVVFGLILLIP